ncbi:hypothetical protein TGAMA5MH_05857 [Trichoderma gamsii]|uniref:DUF6594 domain-containing protein n=1 Tax=Trichoderma gamsii TaxID=398673 RepID=A0A2K0T9H5_9HYPO|nr:hypothetical protein TGAMA5MH_05857 [Trichoderma gamsii]
MWLSERILSLLGHDARVARLLPSSESIVVLSFRALQLRRIAELQDDLLRISAVMGDKNDTTEEERRTIDEALSAYAQAIRNYETLSDNAAPTVPHSATFIGSLQALNMTSSSNSHFASILPPSFEREREFHHYREGIYRALGSMADMNVRNGVIDEAIGPVGFREIDQAGRIHRAKRKAFTTRLVFALLGGISLIGPILIMTLHASTTTSLITVSVATFIFALVMALFATDVGGKDVLAATAAYAAVLVVFIGTSTSSNAS